MASNAEIMQLLPSEDQRQDLLAQLRPFAHDFKQQKELLKDEKISQEIQRMGRESDFQAPRTEKAEEQYSKAVADHFRRVFHEPNLTLADSAGARIIICWRILKTMAQELRFANPGDTLEQILCGDDSVGSPLTSPIPMEGKFSPRLLLDPFYHRMTRVAKACGINGITLAPPEDPTQKLLWHHYFMHLAARKGIPHTPPEAEQGKYGLRGLMDIDLVDLCWPPTMHMLVFEEKLVEEAAQILSGYGSGGEHGANGLRRWMQSRYDMGQEEFADVLRMAQNHLKAVHCVDTATAKATMIARLENISERATNLDLRVELGAAKALMVAHGIARDDSSDTMSGFEESMRKIAEEDTLGIEYED